MKNHSIADSYCLCENAYLQRMKLQLSIIFIEKEIFGRKEICCLWHNNYDIKGAQP